MMNHSFYSSSQSSAFLTSEHHESFPSYNNYVGYSDYPHPSKFEPYEYRCLPTTTTTHNLLSYQNETLLDQIPASSASVLIQPMESVVPLSSVNLTQINGSASLSSTPHHHHHHLLHQHVYPNESSCSTPPNSIEPTSWIGSGDYQALPSTAPNNISPYRHYSTPCSLYSNNHFYDPTPVTSHQWQQTPLIPIKFESPSYFESSDSFNHPTGEPSTTNDDEKSDSSEQNHWLKPTSTSTPLVIIPPRNPLNGKTRTRDKYRIVYTDQQRCELENEFSSSHYISIPRKAALSLTLKLSERQIKIWFQNRRAKERKLNKKRQESTGSAQTSNHSHDVDSQSDAGAESPNYYGNYSS